jgi:hypothetical protein
MGVDGTSMGTGVSATAGLTGMARRTSCAWATGARQSKMTVSRRNCLEKSFTMENPGDRA